MNNTVEHQKLVDDVLFAVGSLLHCRVWPQVVGNFRTFDGRRAVTIGPVGAADITGIALLRKGSTPYPIGLRIEIECKTGGGTLSKNQKKFRDMVVRFGGIYIQARNVEQVLTDLNRYLTI